jgi:membrane associated rhomboid family serine protease
VLYNGPTMESHLPPSGSAAGLLSEVVDNLVCPSPTEKPAALFIQKNPNDATIVLCDEGELVVFFLETSIGADIEQRLAQALAAERPTVRAGLLEEALFVVSVAGEEPPVPLKKPAKAKAVYRLTRDSLQLLPESISDHSTMATDGRARVEKAVEAARAKIASGASARPAPAQLAALEAQGEAVLAAEGVFSQRSSRPGVTVGLILACVVVAGLQAWGGSLDNTYALLAMGANFGPRIQDGQLDRLVSAGFLHGSPTHLAFNMIYLFYFGRALEAALGASRYLSLYTFTLVGAEALTAYFRPYQLGYGASGAVFGLMGALAALGWVGRDRLPPFHATELTAAAVVMLLFQLVASIDPKVSFVAHAAGAFLGILAIGSRFFLVGLNPLSEGPIETPAGRLFFRMLAFLSLGVLVGGFFTSQWRERTWNLWGVPASSAYAFPRFNLKGQFPVRLQGHVTSTLQPTWALYKLGDGDLDPIIISLIDRNHVVGDTDEAAARTHLQKALESEKDPPPVKPDQIRMVRLGPRSAAEISWETKAARFQRYLFGVKNREVDVLVRVTSYAPGVWDDSARAALASLTRD